MAACCVACLSGAAPTATWAGTSELVGGEKPTAWDSNRGAALGALLGLLAVGAALLWEHRRLRRSFRQVALLADASRDAVFGIDCRGRLKFWGRSAEQLFGERLAQARGKALGECILAPASRERLTLALEQLRIGADAAVEWQVPVLALDASGQEFSASLTLKLVEPRGSSASLAVMAFVRDLRPELALQVRSNLAASVFTHAREGIIITDPNGAILEVNEAFSTVTGYARAEVVGSNPRMFQSGRQGPEFYRAMWAALREQGHWSGEIWNRRKTGEIYPELLNISAVRDAEGRVQHYVGLFTDISELKNQQLRLEQMAHFDVLTGLPNRSMLMDRLRHAAATALRWKRWVAAIHLDVDMFTAINERVGQSAGDEILRHLAQRLQASLREGDTVARVGGDKFALLLCELEEPLAAREVIERIQLLFGEPFEVDQHTIKLSASLGVALFPDDSDNPVRVLRGAEHASYRAKQVGRGSVCYFDAAHDAVVNHRNALLLALREALRLGQFVLHYQPKVDMVQSEVIGVEALIRWRHPVRGLVPPAEFLPVLEDDALGLDVGDWVLETAVQQASEWARQGLPLPVSVNISGRHLQSPGFIERIGVVLRRHTEVPPRLLQIEILETSALEDLRTVRQQILDAAALGVSFALDDFGTGYSSLAYLKHLPVRTLKIDQAFVRGMDRDPGDRAIVETVIGLARAFGRDVIAEGVETQEQAKLLIALGCSHAQGYRFSPAIEAAAVPAWVQGFSSGERLDAAGAGGRTLRTEGQAPAPQ